MAITKKTVHELDPGLTRLVLNIWADPTMNGFDWQSATTDAQGVCATFGKTGAKATYSAQNEAFRHAIWIIDVLGNEFNNFEHSIALLRNRYPELGISVGQVDQVYTVSSEDENGEEDTSVDGQTA